MKKRNGSIVLYVGNPSVGNDVSGLMRELAALDGIRRVVPLSKVPRLLVVEYDQRVIAARTLLAYARLGWATARLVGV
jgi:hypothetical protein